MTERVDHAADPGAEVSGLLDACVSMLGLEFVAVRCRAGDPFDVVRAGEPASARSWPRSLDAVVDDAAAPHGPVALRRVPNPLADGEVSLALFRLGSRGDAGVLVAAARRANFPDEREALRLEVTAGRVAMLALERENEGFRELEATLQKRERESTLIMDNIPNLVSILTANGTPELINRRIIEYTGKTEAELKGWAGSQLVHADDRASAIETFKRCIPAGDFFEIIYRMLGADGGYRWFHARHLPLKGADGRVFRWCVTVNDIDDRIRAEEALRESDQRSRSIIDGIPGFVATLTPDGDVEAVNRQILEYTGSALPELRQWGTNGIVHPEDMPHVAGIFLKSIAAGVPYEIEQRLRRHDGEYRWFSNRGIPARDASGTILRWYVLLIDIHERWCAEEALRASEVNLRKIINTLPTTAWSTLPDGYCDFLSHRWLHYAGYTAEQAEGWGWGGVIHPDDTEALVSYWQACLASGSPVDVEARMRRYDGTYRWFLFRANPLRDDAGNIVKWYGTNIDIEDRKRAEAALGELRSELARMARISSLGILTASVAHEINQPLAGIVTNATTCQRMLSANPPNVEGALETMRRTLRDGNRAAQVVTRLRNLFSNKSERNEALDLNEAAAEVVALASADLQRNRVLLRTDYASDLPRLIADRVQLQQVVLNLLLNAADALSSVEDRPRMIVIRTAGEPDGVRLSVEDSGVGFTGVDTERLFEAFYTTKSEGMGIGLSVSRSIIESHNGRLWGEPNSGPGATFSFSLPVGGGA